MNNTPPPEDTLVTLARALRLADDDAVCTVESYGHLVAPGEYRIGPEDFKDDFALPGEYLTDCLMHLNARGLAAVIPEDGAYRVRFRPDRPDA